MYGKTLMIGSLFLMNLALTDATAHADVIVTPSASCQAHYGQQELDLVRSPLGLKNTDGSPLMVTCSIPRSPVAFDKVAKFYVDGSNYNGSSTTCTVSVYDYHGDPKAFRTITGTGLRWDLAATFEPGQVSLFDYVSVICTLPGAGNGLLFGVASVEALP